MSITTADLAAAGVVGAGGAGFPTHVKLSGKADTVVINAAECEPLLHKDKEIILRYGESVVEGLARGMELTGASRGVVGIKRKYKHVIDSLQPKLRRGMEIVPLDDAYPAGDEFVLVYKTLGRVIPPGGIPLAVGAVVMNVETAYNVARTGESPVVEKFVSVAGAVRRPVSVRVPIGAPLSVCLAAAGGTDLADPAFVLGGVMMGTLAESLDGPVTKTTGGIIVLPRDHFIVRRKSWDWNKTMRVGRAACDQCSHCTELCPRYLLGHPIEPHKSMRSLGFSMNREADVPGSAFCSECNLCSYSSCPEGLDPRGVNHQNKMRLIAEKKREGVVANEKSRFIYKSQQIVEKRRKENMPFDPDRPNRLMAFRQTPTKRLMQRVDLLGFDNHGPLREELLDAAEVTLLLKQHIGASLVPTVKPGDAVRKGDVVAVRPVADGKPALGADLHASIDGVVRSVGEKSIVIGK
ncbi:MAG: SLBB domain-containing protein [Thermoguttaceae bacterium]|nr:SLBB domain-containing protein [Thermoguttaceae bacterium]